MNARQLALAHRLIQARLGAQLVLRMRAIWSLLDNDDVDGTFDQWLTAAAPLIMGQRDVSTDVAVAYLGATKTNALGPSARLVPVRADPLAVDRLATALLVTGPLSLKRAAARGGVSRSAANDAAMNGSAAAAMRFALGGGRDTIIQTIKADRQARGYERVASGNACGYCEGLAGITFASDEVFAAHDGCGCTAAPIWA